MYLAYISISNFRGIQQGEIFFNKHSVILGQNNSGKSTIIDAIGLLLGKDKVVRNIGDYDFFGGTPKTEDRILIKGILTGFNSNNPSDFPEWFNSESGSTVLFYNEETNKTRLEFEEGYSIASEIGFCARFDEDNLEYPYLRYFVDSDSDPFLEEGNIKRLNSSHLKNLGFFLLPAYRTWDRLMSFGSELFRKVVRFQDAIPSESIINTREQLRNTEERIEKEEPLKTIIGRINNELSGFIGTKSELSFIPTNGDIDSVIYSLMPFISQENKFNIPVGKNGSGLISLQTLLLLLEFGNFRRKKNENFILSAEEPELHLQPALHRRLIGRIRGLSNQSIVSTHSPEIASYYNPNEIIILKNTNGKLNAFHLLSNNRKIPDPNALMRLYTIYRSSICESLMNTYSLLPEGLTEFRWFKNLINSCITAEGWKFYNQEITFTRVFGVLPTQDAKIIETYENFRETMESIVPLVDGDGAGKDYIKKLTKLDSPPGVILRLEDNKDLESLIAWILSPQKIYDFDILSKHVGEKIESNEELNAYLKKYKQKWDVHELITEFIISQSSCFQRTQTFVNSINLYFEKSNDFEKYWLHDNVLSTKKSNVYYFKLS